MRRRSGDKLKGGGSSAKSAAGGVKDWVVRHKVKAIVIGSILVLLVIGHALWRRRLS